MSKAIFKTNPVSLEVRQIKTAVLQNLKSYQVPVVGLDQPHHGEGIKFAVVEELTFDLCLSFRCGS